jgi:hypothetical protein
MIINKGLLKAVTPFLANVFLLQVYIVSAREAGNLTTKHSVLIKTGMCL